MKFSLGIVAIAYTLECSS